jgi:hypothetical protein
MAVKKPMRVLLITLLLMLVLAVPASAGRWIQAEGTATFVFGSWESRTTTDIDGKCLIKIKQALRLFDGTLVGEGREDITVIAQGPCEGIYPGKYDDRYFVRGEFEGTADGHEGTCRYLAFGRIWAGTPPTEEKHTTFLGCTGELEGLRGVLHSNWDDEYWGWICLGDDDD